MKRPEWRALAKQVHDGLSDPAIAKLYGVDPRTVLRWRQRYGLLSHWEPDRAAHGTPSRYSSGCNCGPCRAAHGVIQKGRRARNQAATIAAGVRRWHARWTPDEDAVLVYGQGTVAERAARLGRTYNAAVLRLTKLHKASR